MENPGWKQARPQLSSRSIRHPKRLIPYLKVYTVGPIHHSARKGSRAHQWRQQEIVGPAAARRLGDGFFVHLFSLSGCVN